MAEAFERLQKIQAEDVADLCLGSVFLATGGGGDPYVNQLLTEAALRSHGPVALVAASALPDAAWVLPLGEVGAPTVSLEQLPVGDEPLVALARYESATGRRVTHLIPFEVGGANSVLPLVAAAARGLPVVDGDGMGRALPEAQMMTFAIAGVPPTPAVAVDYLGNTVTFDTANVDDYERQVRHLAIAMGGMIFTAEHGMVGAHARGCVVPDTLSFAVGLGRLLRQRRGPAKDLLPELEALFASSSYGILRHLYTGKVVDIDRRVQGGFDIGEATLAPLRGPGEPLTIAIRNEYLLASCNDRVLASVPDLIVVVDSETATPINAERLAYGQRVSVLGIGCPGHYRSEPALRVVGPRCFGFDCDYVPIEDLPAGPG